MQLAGQNGGNTLLHEKAEFFRDYITPPRRFSNIVPQFGLACLDRPEPFSPALQHKVQRSDYTRGTVGHPPASQHSRTRDVHQHKDRLSSSSASRDIVRAGQHLTEAHRASVHLGT